MDFGQVPALTDITNDLAGCWMRCVDGDGVITYCHPQLGEQYEAVNELGEVVANANYIGKTMMYQFSTDTLIDVDAVHAWRHVKIAEETSDA